jgi:hypothetical protein
MLLKVTTMSRTSIFAVPIPGRHLGCRKWQSIGTKPLSRGKPDRYPSERSYVTQWHHRGETPLMWLRSWRTAGEKPVTGERSSIFLWRRLKSCTWTGLKSFLKRSRRHSKPDTESVMNLKSLLLATSLVIPSVAHATEGFCALVSKTPDGFLALRQENNVKSKMLMKLNQGDLIEADTAGASEGWMRVLTVHHKGKVIFNVNQTGEFKPAWVVSRYTRYDAECTNRMYEYTCKPRHARPGLAGQNANAHDVKLLKSNGEVDLVLLKQCGERYDS